MWINAKQRIRRILTRIQCAMPWAGRLAPVLLLLTAMPYGLHAQDEVVATLDQSPRVRHLAAAISDPDSRTDALLTMVVVAELMDNLPSLEADQVESTIEKFQDDRAWLDRLASRYLTFPMRSTVFDPAAWLIVRELDQHGLNVDSLVSPLGPELEVLLTQLFDRSEERLSSAILPEVIVRMEFRAIGLWRELLETATSNENLLAVMAGLDSEWFDPWMAAEPPAPLAADQDPLQVAQELMGALLDSATLPAPPDPLALKRIRYELLSGEYAENPMLEVESNYVVRLAAGIDFLYQGQYLSFTEALLWVVADLLKRATTDGSFASPIAPLLADLLPRVSNHYARSFAEVDPRINAVLAAAYDVVQNLKGGHPGAERARELSLELADAVAQLVLTIPDTDYYFGQPVRETVATEIEICISIAAAQDREGRSTLSRDQYDRCLVAIVDLVEQQARSTELSGDSDGPFGDQHLARELSLPPWQRINYVLGYMHDTFPAMCDLPEQPLPNPLEWATLATLMAWFAERAPVYFQTPDNEALVMQMRQTGLDLVEQLSQQADCFSGAGAGMNDPVSRSLQGYDSALLDLVHGVREAELAFRVENLEVGADVVLAGDANQRTSYRSEGIMISACNAESTCGMSESLEATRALVGLFPDAYLIADQSGLGEIQICYDNVQWLDRRSEPVRPEDPFVANYFGHLGFEIKGQYVENGDTFDVFGSTFISPDEYHYLFAALDPEVLDDACPSEIVGTKIHANLDPNRRLKVVPDRLTYLASARNRPSSVLIANWGQGAEWRDWFVTGIGVTQLEYDGDPTIGNRVSQHLQSLYQSQQSMVYSALLRPIPNDAIPAGLDLFEMTQSVSSKKAFVRSIISLFYPSLLLDSDTVRAALEGQGGLLDEVVLSRFQENNVPVASISELGSLRLEQFRADWGRLPEDLRRSGSVANSVAHALIRLNTVYQDFFGLQSNQPPPRGPRL
ncbi:MAG TPA: hypothetical protein VJ984_14810 [Xanthomonadales bacterium]|nr:hypothetical protein [Xanthomonadales bacterium]